MLPEEGLLSGKILLHEETSHVGLVVHVGFAFNAKRKVDFPFSPHVSQELSNWDHERISSIVALKVIVRHCRF